MSGLPARKCRTCDQPVYLRLSGSGRQRERCDECLSAAVRTYLLRSITFRVDRPTLEALQQLERLEGLRGPTAPPRGLRSRLLGRLIREAAARPKRAR